jgi:2-phospho-L-lactate guanylyltransferase
VIAALVPIRGFTSGKARWGELPPERRRDLVRALAIAALEAAAALDIHVVTPDPEVAAWAAGRGLAVLPDRGADLNETLELARAETLAAGAASVLVMFADLPRVTAADVAALVDLAGPATAVIAPDAAGEGTNALHVGPTSPVRYRFGVGSFARHLAEAPDARIVRRPGLAHDLDELHEGMDAGLR